MTSGNCLPFLVPLVLFFLAGQCTSTTPAPQAPQKRLKLLFYTAADEGSHHMKNVKIAETLVRRGHDVTFLLSNSCTKWRDASGAAMFKFAVHQSRYTAEDRERDSREYSRLALRGELLGTANAFKLYARQVFFTNDREWFNFHSDECDSLLGDSATIRALREERFDMLVGEDLSDCHPLLAEILGIKFVLYGAHGIIPSKGHWYGIPRHPAYIPEHYTGLTDNMNLLQRLVNTCLYVAHDLGRRASLWRYEKLQRKYNLSPETSMPEMMARAQLWLFTTAFGLEFTRPLQPNVVVFASPMLGIPSDAKIPKDMLEFLDAANEGVVLFTLGNCMTEMGTAQAQMFANGLARLSQRIIWQFAGNLSHLRLGNNTKMVQWMPQQKLMEHPNTKVFLSHGGRNGLYEAAWYGLPVVGIPLFEDQLDNLEGAVAKGMALQLDILTLTEDALYETVTRVVEEPRFRERAQHISHLLRDQPVMPSEKAAYWIAHVGRYGGEHLRPRAADLSWIEFHLVDVYALSAAILLGVLGIFVLCCKGCLWLVCRNKRQEKLKVN